MLESHTMRNEEVVKGKLSPRAFVYPSVLAKVFGAGDNFVIFA